MAITDAVCIPAKCGKTSRDFYMMYYKAFDGKWVLTYGKKELPRSSGGAGNAVAVKLDSVRTGPQYKCPHCGQKYTFKCWNCGKSTCYDGDDQDGREVVCAHCGESGVFRTVSSGGGGGKAKDVYGYGVNGQE